MGTYKMICLLFNHISTLIVLSLIAKRNFSLCVIKNTCLKFIAPSNEVTFLNTILHEIVFIF